ncbi:MAG: TetR/AcrR family transcriptional regulator [Rhodothermaceae bacterium]
MNKTREKITRIAIELFAVNPAASMDEVAKKAEVGRATLFRHFKCRNDLLNELTVNVETLFEESVKPVIYKQEKAEVIFKEVVELIIPLGARFQFLSYVPLKTDNEKANERYKSYLNALKDLVKKMIDEKLLSDKMPVEWLANNLDSMIFTAWVSIQDGDIAPKQASQLVIDCYLKGFGA